MTFAQVFRLSAQPVVKEKMHSNPSVGVGVGGGGAVLAGGSSTGSWEAETGSGGHEGGTTGQKRLGQAAGIS